MYRSLPGPGIPDSWNSLFSVAARHKTKTPAAFRRRGFKFYFAYIYTSYPVQLV